jgi:hypothetical protein
MWMITGLALIALQIAVVLWIFEGDMSTPRERDDSAGRRDPSRASWTGSAMQDSMEGGE